MDWDKFRREGLRDVTLTLVEMVTKRINAVKHLDCEVDYSELLYFLRSPETEWQRALERICKGDRASIQKAYARAEREVIKPTLSKSKSNDQLDDERAFMANSVVGRGQDLERVLSRPATIPQQAEVRSEAVLKEAMKIVTQTYLTKFGHVRRRPRPTRMDPDPPYDPEYCAFRARMRAMRYDYQVQRIVSKERLEACFLSALGSILAGDNKEADASWSAYLEALTEGVELDKRNRVGLSMHTLWLAGHAPPDTVLTFVRTQPRKLRKRLLPVCRAVSLHMIPKISHLIPRKHYPKDLHLDRVLECLVDDIAVTLT
ncbi:hypothetical protein GMRT_14939 [Giardia muris]|uniref:Uncharacterized protein n=1 Tax=Giardia muris TaxID=5742 RepID=A0A4Z1T9H0_GIAMU|nr:hypothetical protein GMRT_14939 [Giardia muris]|eukprot:TNJ29171.1 hypothetical protein GMRT_14939 [Giardia muris]